MRCNMSGSHLDEKRRSRYPLWMNWVKSDQYQNLQPAMFNHTQFEAFQGSLLSRRD